FGLPNASAKNLRRFSELVGKAERLSFDVPTLVGYGRFRFALRIQEKEKRSADATVRVSAALLLNWRTVASALLISRFLNGQVQVRLVAFFYLKLFAAVVCIIPGTLSKQIFK